MTSSFAEIIKWVQELDFWEKAAFDLVISGREFTDDDIDLLVQYLLEDNKLNEKRGKRPDLKFEDYVIPKADDALYQLIRISNLRNINALAPEQTLEFGSHLTAVFGVNGSGKSGYARVLGSAGFTRGDEEIISDITKPFDPEAPQLVDIELASKGETFSIEHKVGTPCPQLGSFYVFDSTSVIVHLTQKNNISFSPAGLAYLQTLANLTDEVREKLSQRVERKKKENIFISLFHEESKVKEVVSSISHETNFEVLRELANFSPGDDEALIILKSRISTIETKGIPTQIKELEQGKADLSQLISKINSTIVGLDSEMVDEINKDINNAITHLEVANTLGLESFKAGRLKSVGTEEWHTFIHAAKDLSSVEGESQERSYPQEDSHCLLCQQPLSNEANDLIEKLWKYLGSEVQVALKLAEERLISQLDVITDLDTAYFEDELAVSRLILERDEVLHTTIKTERDTLVSLKEKSIKGIKEHQEIKSSKINMEYVRKLEEIIIQIEAEITKWREEEGKVENLRTQRIELEHKKLLSKHLEEIEEFVQELGWIEKASKIGGTTRHITAKYNQMFAELVTDEYIELFEKTLEELGRPLKVHIITNARKGEVYKQLVLEADESTPARLTSPDKILSEGEKRAVALADFLTEISLDASSRGIILDDPVTSLDLDWRKKIANTLVDEAKQRQVIVFTHDMPFLYYMREAGESQDVPADYHWITRNSTNGLPGYIHLHNSPVLEQDYRDDRRARECYEEAKDAAPQKQLAHVREGFAALRTSYEAVIMFDLLKGVVKRFEERTSFMNLKSINWDEVLVEKIVEKCEYCSSLMEGHSHSDALGAEFPTPKMLLDEIEEFNIVRKQAKKKK